MTDDDRISVSAARGPVPPDPADLEAAIRYRLHYTIAKEAGDVTTADLFHAVSLAVKDIAVDRLLASRLRSRAREAKRVYYLSMEFLPGRTLGNNLLNLGLYEACRKALRSLGGDIDAVLDEESDPGLGNGGLGRLASCLLDSMATLGITGFGYGINYQFGLFRQVIEDGWQVEKPDRWKSDGAYWQITRPERVISVQTGGRVVYEPDARGQYRPKWVETQTIEGVPHDMPIVGYGGKTVNFLRLYSARAAHDFDMRIFNEGDYLKAVEGASHAETISRVLYPSDVPESGRTLRLMQEYFFTACALRDIVNGYRRFHPDLSSFAEHAAIQMNDTHPAIAVAELMRLLVDENDIVWDEAWRMTTAVLGYTNHTIMSEALERWPVPLFEKKLPRHLEIIYEINARFLKEAAKRWPGDEERLRRLSIIEESSPKQIRMAHLAIVGSHSINGVAALHSELLKRRLFPDFHELWPERFNNKTNGVTPRRWIGLANPSLARLLDRRAGEGWISDLGRLRELERYASDKEFQEEFRTVKKEAKVRAGRILREKLGLYVRPEFLFDVHAKRIHLYKRQLLNVLRIVHDYLRLVDDRVAPAAPQAFIFAGKAAPSYRAAKQVIKLIHSVGRVINGDPRAHDWMTVVFVPDYRVSVAEWLIPAADLSEQISTAGTEASGTGNMKFAMNGALTIGTLDGANIEMREAVGPENLFSFGLTTQQVQDLQARRAYDPAGIVERDAGLRRVIDSLRGERFCIGEPGLFKDLVGAVLDPNDPFLHLADFNAYSRVHDEAVSLYAEPDRWTAKSILNVARMGSFSSDRTVREYAEEIWKVLP
ncbi:MAG: glycogen/starch/alpha-glucan phosphorylase [Elusimicrobiota bacterium]